tara:strand:- start:664 stop:858 length:195 start_codon:yes stop_codon:yes gene_type:complete
MVRFDRRVMVRLYACNTITRSTMIYKKRERLKRLEKRLERLEKHAERIKKRKELKTFLCCSHHK